MYQYKGERPFSVEHGFPGSRGSNKYVNDEVKEGSTTGRGLLFDSTATNEVTASKSNLRRAEATRLGPNFTGAGSLAKSGAGYLKGSESLSRTVKPNQSIKSTYAYSFTPASNIPTANNKSRPQTAQPQQPLRYQGELTGKLADLIRTMEGSSKAELGRAVWAYLHHAASQLPDQPSLYHQQDAKQMVELLVTGYPCPECAAHFRDIIRREPPVVSSGNEFKMWMCRAHNTVNRSIGKPAIDCDMMKQQYGGNLIANGGGDQSRGLMITRGGMTTSFQPAPRVTPFPNYVQPTTGRRRVGCNCR